MLACFALFLDTTCGQAYQDTVVVLPRGPQRLLRPVVIGWTFRYCLLALLLALKLMFIKIKFVA